MASSSLVPPSVPPAFCESEVLKRVEKLKETLNRLPDLEDSQMETTLLRSCLALPKLAHSLRCCPPQHILEATTAFDDAMRDALADLAGGPLPEWSWLKASLPSSRGGLNIRRASLHAPAAYISSLSQSADLVTLILGHVPPVSPHLLTSISGLSIAAERPEWTTLEEIDVPVRQRPLCHCIDDAVFIDLLVSSPDTRSRALALSSALPHAGDWLNVTPSTALGLHLHDREFRLCLQYWLGLRMCEEDVSCPICVGNADAFGDHRVGCGGNGDRIHRHDSLRDTIYSAAQTAALAPRKEVPSLIPGSCSRPADIYLPNWKRGMPAALDVTVISTLQQQTVDGASTTPGYVLKVGEDRKMAAHAEACHSIGVIFTPLVLETLGGWSEEASLTISAIGRLQGQRLGTSPTEATRHLFQRLSISLWKGNATLRIRRQQVRPSSVD